MVTTNALAKHYDCLDPDERLVMLLAAATPGTPRRRAGWRRRPHGWGTSCSTPTGGWRPCGRCASPTGPAGCTRDTLLPHLRRAQRSAARAADSRLYACSRLFGYLLAIQTDGWAVSCARHGLTPEQASFWLDDPVGQESEDEARDAAFTPRSPWPTSAGRTRPPRLLRRQRGSRTVLTRRTGCGSGCGSELSSGISTPARPASSRAAECFARPEQTFGAWRRDHDDLVLALPWPWPSGRECGWGCPYPTPCRPLSQRTFISDGWGSPALA